MGLFSKAVDSFFSSKKKAELKVQKEQEIKEFWIKNGSNLERILDDFFNFLNTYPKDRIDVNDLHPYLKQQKEIDNRSDKLNKSIGTYGLEHIELKGYQEFREKDAMVTIYLNVKMNFCDIRTKSEFIKAKRKELEKKVKKFDGNGFEEFENQGQELIVYEMENMMNHKKQIDLINDFKKTFPTSLSREKEIVAERLGKEGKSIVGTEDSPTKIIDEYEKKKKKVNPKWKPKTFK